MRVLLTDVSTGILTLVLLLQSADGFAQTSAPGKMDALSGFVTDLEILTETPLLVRYAAGGR